MKFVLTGFMLFSSFTAFASPADCDESTLKALEPVMEVVRAAEDEDCPNNKDLDSLCMLIGNRTSDPNPLNEKYPYLYHRRILEASCADPEKNTDQEIQAKVQTLWNSFESELTCDNLQFDVSEGSLLKFAAVSKFDRFMNDVVRWGVNLNRVDPSDNRTVLDYIQYQIERNKGNSTEQKFQSYYDRLKRAGAKHRAEL